MKKLALTLAVTGLATFAAATNVYAKDDKVIAVPVPITPAGEQPPKVQAVVTHVALDTTQAPAPAPVPVPQAQPAAPVPAETQAQVDPAPVAPLNAAFTRAIAGINIFPNLNVGGVEHDDCDKTNTAGGYNLNCKRRGFSFSPTAVTPLNSTLLGGSTRTIAETQPVPPPPAPNVDAQAAKDQAAKDQVAKDQAAKDQAAKDQAAKDQAAKDQAAKDQAAKDQAAKDQAAPSNPDGPQPVTKGTCPANCPNPPPQPLPSCSATVTTNCTPLPSCSATVTTNCTPLPLCSATVTANCTPPQPTCNTTVTTNCTPPADTTGCPTRRCGQQKVPPPSTAGCLATATTPCPACQTGKCGSGLPFSIVSNGKKVCLRISPFSDADAANADEIKIACGDDRRVRIDTLHGDKAKNWGKLTSADGLSKRMATSYRKMTTMDSALTGLEKNQTELAACVGFTLKKGELHCTTDGIRHGAYELTWDRTTKTLVTHAESAAVTTEEKVRGSGAVHVIGSVAKGTLCTTWFVLRKIASDGAHDNCGSNLGQSDAAKEARRMSKDQLRDALKELDPGNFAQYNNDGRRALQRSYVDVKENGLHAGSAAGEDEP